MEERVMWNWGTSGLVVMMCAAQFGCDTDDESTEMNLGEPSEESPEPAAAGDEASPAGPITGPTGTFDGEPFAVRGVLAHRIRENEPIELRLFNRAVSCDNFDDDYRNTEGEPLVSMFLHWPKPVGETVSFRASEVHERFQFCTGRGGDRGHARCEPRAPEQGSLTVLESNPNGGALSFDVSSDYGSLSGRLDFTICARE